MILSTAKQLPWLRIVAEGVVIVASILFAFGIDRGWDNWQERQEESEALGRLHIEFTENRERIELSAFESLAASAEALHRMMQALPAGASSAAVPDTLRVVHNLIVETMLRRCPTPSPA